MKKVIVNYDWRKVEYPKQPDEIVNQVLTEYQNSYDFTTSKRELFQARQKLYMWIKDQQNKIYIRLIFSVIDTLKALYNQDKPVVSFSWRQLWDNELAENINNLARFDYQEMWCEMKKDFIQQHRLFYWVWIEVFDWYDNDTKTPCYKVVNPMCRIPDINYDINYWPRYHWFELQACKSELRKEDWFFNIDELSEWENPSWLNYDKRTAVQYERLLNNDTNSWMLEIYYHYTIIEWKKYLIVLWNNKSTIIKFEEVKPVTKAEIKNCSKVDFPIIVRNYRYLEDDPYWISIPDLLEDKQSMIQLFYNLNRITAEHNAYWDMFMVDDKVIDIKQLQIPTLWPKYIKANLTLNPNPIRAVEKSRVQQSTYDMPWILKQQSSLDVWLDDRSLWVQWDSNITATENQRVQKNANLKLIYWAKLDWIAEKQFWKLWYRFYIEHFRDWSTKSFKLNNKIWSDYFNLKREDFITKENIDLEVITESELEEKKNKERMWLMATINYVLQNPESSKYSKATALRQLAILNWTPREYADIWYPPSIEELRAMWDVELLNNNEEPKEIKDLNEDHWTYIIIYQRAVDTEAKFNAIEKRKQAIMMKGNTVMQPMNVSNGTVTNQVTNNMLQQDNSQPVNATSLSLTQ